MVIELVAHFPGSGRVIPLGNYPYQIFYTCSGDELVILHIRHSARKPLDPSDL
jgi:hypothetical protein